MGLIQFIMDLFVEKDLRFFHNGQNLMAKGEFLKASYEFKEALNIKPTEEKYHDGFGQSLYKRGMMPEADHAFAIADDLKLVSTNPKDVAALCRLAKAFQDKRMFAIAQNYIQRTLSLEPNNDQAHYLLGRANFLGNKHKEALMSYEKAISLNPYCVEAYHGLEDLYRTQGKKTSEKKYGELAKHIAKMRKSPGDAIAHSELGDAFRNHKKASEAEAEYKEALRLDEKCSDALVGLAILKIDGGYLAEAKDSLLKAIKLNKYNSLAHSYLGLLYKDDPRAKKEADWEMSLAKQLIAVEKAKEPLKIYHAYIELGDFLASHKKMEDAEEAFLRGVRANANIPDAYVKLALVYSNSKKADQALSYCDHAIKLAPKKEMGYIGKGRVFMDLGDFEKAISHFQEALKYGQNNPSVHEFLAQAYHKKGMLKLAEKEWKIVDSIKSTQDGAV